MASEDDKMLYTLQNLLHARVTALAEILFERLAESTNESYEGLQIVWRQKSREAFRTIIRTVQDHPACPSPIPAQAMMQAAQAMWRLEDSELSGPSQSNHP